MKFKLWSILFLFSCAIQASNSESSGRQITFDADIDTKLSHVHNQMATYLKEREFIRKTSLLECARRLDNMNMTRAELRTVRDALGIIYAEADETNSVRQVLNYITSNHQFGAIVFQATIKKEVIALRIPVVADTAALVKESAETSSLMQEFDPTAPIVATAVSYGCSSSSHNQLYLNLNGSK